MKTSVALVLMVTSVMSQNTVESQCAQDSETQRQLAQVMEVIHELRTAMKDVVSRLDDLQTYADEPKLVGFWPLSEAHGGKDLSGYGNDIQLNNVIFEKACESCSKTVAFKGIASSYGLIPGGGVLDVQRSFTWMAWVYPESLQHGPLFNWDDKLRSDAHGAHIWLNGKSFFFRVSTTMGGFSAKENLNVGKWNKVALSYHYSSGAFVMYVNGEEEWYDKGVAQTLMRTEGAVTIGSRSALPPYDTRGLHARVACMRLYQGKAAVSLVEETLQQCPEIERA